MKKILIMFALMTTVFAGPALSTPHVDKNNIKINETDLKKYTSTLLYFEEIGGSNKFSASRAIYRVVITNNGKSTINVDKIRELPHTKWKISDDKSDTKDTEKTRKKEG